MKKHFIFLNCVFIIAFIVLYFTFPSSQTYGNDIYILPISTNENLQELQSFQYKGRVYEDEIIITDEYNGVVNIPSEVLHFNTSNYKNGDILEKGILIDSFQTPYRLRIRKIFEDSVLVENIDRTLLSINILPLHPIQKTDVKLSCLDKTEINDYQISFDEQKEGYIITAIIDNDGAILSSMTKRIKVEYGIKKTGKYVKKDFVYEDIVGKYINKVVNIRGVEFITRVYIDTIDTFNEFILVNGEIYDKNIIVKL